jgi:hypothetical protein
VPSTCGTKQFWYVGNVIATYGPIQGYRMNATRDSYEVDEERMAVVRRAFRMVGVEGAGIYSVHKATHYGRMKHETPNL